MWASRIVHECCLHEHDHGNSYITLTYDDDHLPVWDSLHHKHFQDFMKRLRHHVKHRVRFYMCGEYGREKDGTLGRPHYHAILFNQSFSKDDVFDVNNDIPSYTNQFLTELWPKGIAVHNDVTYNAAAYVAGYVRKKVTGIKADDHYSRVDPNTGEWNSITPEYSTMSRRPGIGRGWYDRYQTDFFPKDQTPVPGYGTYNGAPRYYLEMLEQRNPELHEEVKKNREKFMQENKHDYTPERLMDRYKVRKAQTSQLKRPLE